jgi:hypothetical protein
MMLVTDALCDQIERLTRTGATRHRIYAHCLADPGKHFIKDQPYANTCISAKAKCKEPARDVLKHDECES